jgi:ribosomal protein S18 acetylase RimI-like enzyme
MNDFRPMREDETAAVIALWTACDLTRPWNPPEADIALARGNPNAEIFVAEQDEVIISAFMVGHDAHRAWVYYLAVSPDHRREGWGEKAMAAAEDWGRAHNMPKMHLMVRRTNAPVVAFYERLLFQAWSSGPQHTLRSASCQTCRKSRARSSWLSF